MVPARVLQALAAPTIGHLDPSFIAVMDDVKALLRPIFCTTNEFTVPVSGTGSAGMEAGLANFIEPGDPVVIAVKGYFGERMVEMASRYGAEVTRLDRPWGEVFDPEEITQALKKQTYKFVAMVHGETSTGVLQPHVEAIAAAAHDQGALLVLDTVATLGGVPVDVDGWQVDICYAGSQKCLSAPPGLAPITLSPRALETLRRRKSKVTSWYLDLQALDGYWAGGQRVYHHTAPVNMNYALREALRIVLEEGLPARFARHAEVARQLWTGLEALDAPPRAPLAIRNPSLTTAVVPRGVDEPTVRRRLLREYNIEIAGGFGPLAGQVWRIGLMGHSARLENVEMLLSALRDVLS